jgi:Mg-chelatase subunit ChlD
MSAAMSPAPAMGYVFLAIDCSGSMQGTKIEQAKKGSVDFARDAIAKGYFVGLIRFDTFVTLLCNPTDDISKIDLAVSKLDIGYSTYIASAINLAQKKFTGLTGAKAIVIVTDGVPNDWGDPQKSMKAGDKAKKEGIDIIAIGTDDANQEFLKKLASREELGMKVSFKDLEKAIASSSSLLKKKP